MSFTDNLIQLQKITIDDLSPVSSIPVHVLRLDKIHPVISGNKWFKLKYHIEKALTDNHHTILTFGGAYSNHIIATALAARRIGLDSIGIIRGEEPTEWSFTLKDAYKMGMKMHFISREDYAMKNDPSFIGRLKDRFGKFYLIPEGGYGELGAKGAEEILSVTDTSGYSHIICMAGTGTMMAGIINAAKPHQKITGISSMKGNKTLISEIEALLTGDKETFTLLHDYHFGGYAKYDKTLTGFMNNFYHQTKIPSDFVYSGKLFYALTDLIGKKYFSNDEKVLAIHCGGLQGNRSLPAGILDF